MIESSMNTQTLPSTHESNRFVPTSFRRSWIRLLAPLNAPLGTAWIRWLGRRCCSRSLALRGIRLVGSTSKSFQWFRRCEGMTSVNVGTNGINQSKCRENT